MNEWFEKLDEKMKHNWRLRWYYRWAKLRLNISEWYYKITNRRKNENTHSNKN